MNCILKKIVGTSWRPRNDVNVRYKDMEIPSNIKGLAIGFERRSRGMIEPTNIIKIGSLKLRDGERV